jgi:alpha-glucosidase
MKKKYLITILITILVTLTSVYAVPKIYKKFIKNKESYKVVMFGDSLSENADWNDLLNRKDVKNSGRGGFTTSHYNWTVGYDVLIYHPDICFIEGGVNDIGCGIPLDRIKNNYRSVIDTIISNDIELVVQSAFYVNYPDIEKTEYYNNMVDSVNGYISRLALDRKLIYLDMNKFLSNDRKIIKEYTVDGAHLNNEAYKIWASKVDSILTLNGI